MANTNSRKITEYSACNAPGANNLLVVVGNTSGTANTFRLTISNLLGNSQANVIVGNTQVLSANTIIIRREGTPSDSLALGYSPGSFWFDNTHFYCVLANGHIRRASHESFGV
jgi:hypothetical protein